MNSENKAPDMFNVHPGLRSDEDTPLSSEKGRAVERIGFRRTTDGFRQRLTPHQETLEPIGRHLPKGPYPYDLDHGRALDAGQMHHTAANGTNVHITNAGQFYRPWREELALSFAKTIGNFFGWPIRLLGRIAEGIVNAGLGIIKMMLIAVVAPTLIYTGIQMYEARSAGASSAEAAAEVGKEGIKLVGAVLSGIWDGIFDGEESEPKSESRPNGGS